MTIGPKLRAGLLLGGMFLAGGAAGGAFAHWHDVHEMREVLKGPPGEARIRIRLRAMRRHLDLSDDQLKKVEAILRDAEKEREEAEGPCRKELDALHDKVNKQIEELLTPEQRAKHEAAMARWHGRPPL